MVNGKTIVITGCLQGIGKETLRVFAEHKANVFACAMNETEEFGERCKALAEENKVFIKPVYFDMMDDESIKAAIKEIRSEKRKIDGLINIAGMNRDALFPMVTKQDMLDTFQVNFYSNIILSQYIAKMMQRDKVEGSIVFTSSLAAIYGSEGQLSYAASKAALIGAMRTMALELGKCHIRVNAVAPGVIKTPMTDNLESDLIDKHISRMDIPRLGEAEEVAKPFLFLMSDMSKHVSGQIIRIDGGM